MREMRFGIQFFTWHTAPETVDYARRAITQFPFHRVWLTDHLTYENVFVTLPESPLGAGGTSGEVVVMEDGAQEIKQATTRSM